jgi:SnoaL-like domain
MLKNPHHTKMKIPSIIAAFVKAQNDRDSSAVVSCFADEAVVHDEGQERRGLVAIKEWSDKGFQKFQYSIEPKGLTEENEKTILTATVTGNFPGSPVSLDFKFVIDGDKIVSLIID